MASGTIPMAGTADVYMRSIYTATSGTIHIAFDSGLDAMFSVSFCRSQVGYLPGTVEIFKKTGQTPTYLETHGTGTVTQVTAVAHETNGLSITFNVGYIRAIVTGNVPFSLTA